jgi:hypothetical protein
MFEDFIGNILIFLHEFNLVSLIVFIDCLLLHDLDCLTDFHFFGFAEMKGEAPDSVLSFSDEEDVSPKQSIFRPNLHVSIMPTCDEPSWIVDWTHVVDALEVPFPFSHKHNLRSIH